MLATRLIWLAGRSRWKGSRPMKDLTALTPPLLMAAAVITAVVMFLRHEMARGRSGDADPEDNISASGTEPVHAADNEPRGEDATTRPGTEG